MRKELYILGVAAFLAACTDEVETGITDVRRDDARIQVAMGFAPMDVTTRATVTAEPFAGREPTEANPFYPMVWFSETQGVYNDTDDKHRNKVKFTSSTLTFPDTDIEYDEGNTGEGGTKDKDKQIYCIGLYPTNTGLWGTENTTEWDTAGWSEEDRPQGTILYADIQGQEDLMFASEVSGSINDKFNSGSDSGKLLQFHHLLTWLKIRVNAAEQGAGDAWGKLKLVQVKSKKRCRVDLGRGEIFEKTLDSDEYRQIQAFAPDEASGYKDLEPDEPESPQVSSVLVVPEKEYELTYQTEAMSSPATVTVSLTGANDKSLESADDARNSVFVITLSFYQRNKVEATCALEAMTDEPQALYGGEMVPLDMGAIGGTFTYDGSAQKPSIIVSADGSNLTDGTDYHLVYSDNINSGTASVTAIGAGTYAGRQGVQTFTISKAEGSGTISFNETSVSKKFLDADFTQAANTSGLTGSGTISYTLSYNSSNADVATVGSSTGLVSIMKPGSTTITATVGDGRNHTYASPPSTTYELTVNKADGSIAFAQAAVASTYNDAAFTNELSKVGDGTVTYDSNNTSVATVDASGQVTIAGAGSATITATVTDGTYYAYSPNTATYTLEVEKAVGTISFAETTVNKTQGDAAFTNTLTNTGDGSVTYASSKSSVAMVNASTGEVTLGGGLGYATIIATVADGANYTYPVSTAQYTIYVTEAETP